MEGEWGKEMGQQSTKMRTRREEERGEVGGRNGWGFWCAETGTLASVVKSADLQTSSECEMTPDENTWRWLVDMALLTSLDCGKWVKKMTVYTVH